MDFKMNWHITIGTYKLAMLASVEVHRSVDVLADTCTIVLPGYAHNAVLKEEGGKRLEELIKRGDAVTVKLGYDDKLIEEFKGFVLSFPNDNGTITINCEDDLFLLRKAVKDKEFKNKTVKQIAEYLISETGVPLKVNCTLTIDYDKFVISKATAYDVLKKLQEETKANIYLRNGELHIHPPYIEQHGKVRYSFQKNIETDDLKYIRKEDRKIEIVVENTAKDGKKIEKRAGTTGGDKNTLSGSGMSEAAMQQLAEAAYRRRWYDGYEGSITTWLIPYVTPGYSAEIKDADFEYKTGWYYVTAVTTTFDNNGGVRKVQLGIKLG